MSVSSRDILEAAEAQFSGQGYANTSLRQLMAAARVSTTAFYSRYRSKEAVLIALVDAAMKELFIAGSETLAGVASVAEGIAAGIDVLLGTLTRHRSVVRLALSEGAAIAEVRDTVARALATLAELLASHIAASRPSRRRRRDDLDRAWALVGALHLQITRWLVFDQLGDDEIGPRLAAVARSLLVADPGSEP